MQLENSTGKWLPVTIATKDTASAPGPARTSLPAPFIGMPCLYIPTKDNEFSDKSPKAAIITQVNADGSVNLHAFHNNAWGMHFRDKVTPEGPGNTGSGWDYCAPWKQ